MKFNLLLFYLSLLLATGLWGQTLNVSNLGENSGWYSDDTRTSEGVVLNGTNFSFQPFFDYPGAPEASAANDALIAQQIKFTNDYSGSTKGVLVLDGTSANLGKSSIRFYGDGNGIGTLDATFTSTFRWYMDPYPTSRTPALNLLVKGSDTLIYSLSWVGSDSQMNAWNEFTINSNTNGWRVYNNGAPGSSGDPKSLDSWFNDPTLGGILLDAEVIGQGFNIGSWQRQCRVGIDWLESSLLNNGNRIEFIAPVHNTTQDTYFASIQPAINAAAAGNVIEVAAGTYVENITVNKALSINGPNASLTGNGTRNPEAIISGPFLVNANNVTIKGFYIDGTNVNQNPPNWLNMRGVLVGNVASQSNVTIENNIIKSWVTGVSLAGGGSFPWNETILIKGNKFVGTSIGSTENVNGLSVLNNYFENGGLGLGVGAVLTALTGNNFINGTGRYVSAAPGVVVDFPQVLANNTFDKTVYLNTASGQWYDRAIFTTISGAVTAAASGATLLVSEGIFNENVVINKNVVMEGSGSATIIDGVQAGSQLGTIQLTSGRSNVIIKNFHIKGLDGPTPGLEKAAVYLQGTQTDITIEGNIIEARGDAALMGEYNASNNNIIITGNNFTGQTFTGEVPATGDQFSVPNVARQAIVFGGGSGTTNTQNFTFTNNTIETLAGASGVGNTLVTLDLVGTNTITGNAFLGYSSANGLRVRGGGTYAINNNDLSGNFPVKIFRQGSEVNAECNWFGTANANTIVSGLSGAIDFSPYLVSGTDDDKDASGFQPEAGVCTGTPVMINSLSSTDAICDANAVITINFSGGSAPYTIELDGEELSNDTEGSPFLVEDLTSGTYTIVVTDANGSSQSATISISSFPIGNETTGVGYNTLSAAYTAASPNDVIKICAGVYDGTLLTFTKPITIKGAKSGVDGRERGIGQNPEEGETVIAGTGRIFNLNISGVTLDGLYFRNINHRGIDCYAVANDFTVKNCVFNVTSTNSSGGAIQFGGGSNLTANNFLFENNLVRGSSTGYLLFFLHSANDGIINENTLNSALFMFGPFGQADRWEITSNLFDGEINETPYLGYGINAQFGEATVDGNTLRKLLAGFQISIVGGSVTNNVFDDNDFYGLELWGGTFNSPVSSDVDISNNSFTYNGTGASANARALRIGRTSDPAPGINGSTISVNNNSFTDLGTVGGVKAIEFNGNSTLDASCNWWGTVDAVAIDGKNSAQVATMPFLSSGVDGDEDASGFQPVINDQEGYISAISGNNQPIFNGSEEFSPTNLTLMGSVDVGGTLVRNYTLTMSTSCGGTNGAELTSLSFEGDEDKQFDFTGIKVGDDLTPGTYNFSVSYLAASEEGEDVVTAVLTTSSGEFRFALKAVTTAPVSTNALAEVYGNSLLISNGDFTPSTSDHTNFGSRNTPGTLSRTFTIQNSAPSESQDLDITSVVFVGGQSANFEVTSLPCGPIAPGASCEIEVLFDSEGESGDFSTTLRVVNSDPANNPYEFAISAQVLAPNLVVLGNNIEITNGDDTPQSADNTLFGNANTGQTINKTFFIKNVGQGLLEFPANAVSVVESANGGGFTNFEVIAQPSGPLSPNQETFFTVRFTSPGQGNFFADLEIESSADDFSFTVQGTGPSPRMQVTGNNVDIPDGSVTVSTGNFTNYGTRSRNTNLDRTFYVRNPSSLGAQAPLQLVGNPRVSISGGSGMFSVTIQPGASVGVNSSSLFRIRYRPTANGCHEATVSIDNNDPIRDPYTFVIWGRTTGQFCDPPAMGLPGVIEWIAIDADEEIEELSVYPNPASHWVTIISPERAEEYSIEVVNINGQIVHTSQTLGGNLLLDVSSWPAGMYFIHSQAMPGNPVKFVKH